MSVNGSGNQDMGVFVGASVSASYAMRGGAPVRNASNCGYYIDLIDRKRKHRMHRFIMATFALIATPAIAASPAFSPTETAAIYKATGFRVQGGKVTGCDAADPTWPRSTFFIEAVDLSGDGKPEAIVTESNTACYGRDEQGFTVLAKGPDGNWRRLAGGPGATLVLKTRHNGWLDIEYGGPGMQKHPVLRWDGKTYR